MSLLTGRPELSRMCHTIFFISAQSSYLVMLSHWVATALMTKLLSSSLLSLRKSK
jgi:hypothetical protein